MIINQLNNNNHKYKLVFKNTILKAGQKVILDNENSIINFSNMVIIKGQIGSGKSTILKAISNLVPVENGDLYIEDSDNNFIKSIYIHSQPELNFLTGYVKDELKIAGITDYKPFKDYLSKSVYELSGGAMKKISLLISLHFSENKMILADEPLDMLDDNGALELANIVMEYSKISPFIIATHDNHFDSFADALIYL